MKNNEINKRYGYDILSHSIYEITLIPDTEIEVFESEKASKYNVIKTYFEKDKPQTSEVVTIADEYVYDCSFETIEEVIEHKTMFYRNEIKRYENEIEKSKRQIDKCQANIEMFKKMLIRFNGEERNDEK